MMQRAPRHSKVRPWIVQGSAQGETLECLAVKSIFAVMWLSLWFVSYNKVMLMSKCDVI